METDMHTFDKLVARYGELTGQPVDCRWKESTVAKKVAELEEQVREAAEDKARKESEAQVAEEMRLARIEGRGPWEEFSKLYRRDDSEGALARAVVWAIRVIEQHEEMTAKLTEEFSKNPAHAMSWGGTYFSHAADYNAAMGLKGMFEGGATVEGMIQSVSRDVRHKAAYPARSTSPTSNLMSQEELRAATKLLGYLDGSEYF